jgi:hypothetical protein
MFNTWIQEHHTLKSTRYKLIWDVCDFLKLFFKLSCVCLSLKKLINRKYFSIKWKFGLVFRKVFFFYFGRKTLSGSCEKIRNIILFAHYIEFGPHFYNYYLLFSYYFLIEIFYLSNLILVLLIVTYFIWNNLWNGNYYYFNFFIFQFFLFVRLDLYYFDYYLFYLR